MHKAFIFENITKIIPNFDQSGIHAVSIFMATPPIVFATSKKSHPPKIKA
jgi:hypothetical protein